ncbi:hypothetical protein CEXT_386691 [Caerostris extrusa]|uniref:Uncharacterized protein n=1 Tax=Caerostris extrusa TaxID=172846 RepID=A0AAV4REY6_CAEEX|nr:hypothetical protein CEXT_386691 [Caerostris extrusa]
MNNAFTLFRNSKINTEWKISVEDNNRLLSLIVGLKGEYEFPVSIIRVLSYPVMVVKYSSVAMVNFGFGYLFFNHCCGKGPRVKMFGNGKQHHHIFFLSNVLCDCWT